MVVRIIQGHWPHYRSMNRTRLPLNPFDFHQDSSHQKLPSYASMRRYLQDDAYSAVFIEHRLMADI